MATHCLYEYRNLTPHIIYYEFFVPSYSPHQTRQVWLPHCILRTNAALKKSLLCNNETKFPWNRLCSIDKFVLRIISFRQIRLSPIHIYIFVVRSNTFPPQQVISQLIVSYDTLKRHRHFNICINLQIRKFVRIKIFLIEQYYNCIIVKENIKMHGGHKKVWLGINLSHINIRNRG